MIPTAEAASPRRGWYYGWNIVGASVLSQIAATGLTYSSFSLFVQDWSADFHVPISQLQLAVAALALLCAATAPVIGGLADHYPARRMLACGLTGIGLFYCLMSLTTSAWQVIALYGLFAPIALGLSTSVTVNALISRWFVRRLGLALGLGAFGMGMAGVLLPPLISGLLPEIGWRMIWRASGLLVAAAVMPIVVSIVRERATEREGLHYLAAGDNPAVQKNEAAAVPIRWREVCARKNFWLLVAIYLPILAMNGGFGQNLAPYAASHGFSQQSAGELLAILNLSNVAATLVLGLLSDRFGNRLPLAGLALLVAAGAVILSLADGFPIVILGCVLVGFGGAVFTPIAAAMAVEFGAGFGLAFGMTMFFIPVVSLFPFVIAKAQEKTGNYAPALLGMMVLVLASATLTLALREKARPSE